MTRPLRLGLSTCPNDTFLGCALLEGRLDTRGLELALVLADVEELNAGLLAGELDAGKGSYHAALTASARLGVLPVGSALGFGNGPLLLAREPGARPAPGARVLCPGTHTTASLLYRLFHPDGPAPEQVLFSAILPALEAGEADFGVCIHEARFTYRERGLALVEDLGLRWERDTAAPLPLGGLFARRDLGAPTLRRLAALLSESLAWARAHPEATLPTMRAHAQELDDAVIRAHVELYVNEHTVDLGPAGRAALAQLAARARAAGLVAADAPDLALVGVPRLFHLADPAAWEAGGEPWRPPSLEREGFVHLSLAGQLAGTLEAHFAGAPALALLEVDAQRVGADLAMEPSRGGERFPHLRAPLPRTAVLRRWPLARGADGAWALPRLGEDPAGDDPPGDPPARAGPAEERP